MVFVALLAISFTLFATALSHGSQEPAWIRDSSLFVDVIFFPLYLLGRLDSRALVPEIMYEISFLILWLFSCAFWAFLAMAVVNRIQKWRAKIV